MIKILGIIIVAVVLEGMGFLIGWNAAVDYHRIDIHEEGHE